MAILKPVGRAWPAQPVVLLVEEQRLLAWDIAAILATRGLRCASVPDGVAAAALLAQHPSGYAAAVVDLPLPATPSGQRIVRRLRALRPHLPIVVTSAFATSARDADLRGLGGPTARVPKPFTAAELLAALDEVMTAPMLRARRRRRFQGYEAVVQPSDA